MMKKCGGSTTAFDLFLFVVVRCVVFLFKRITDFLGFKTCFLFPVSPKFCVYPGNGECFKNKEQIKCLDAFLILLYLFFVFFFTSSFPGSVVFVIHNKNNANVFVSTSHVLRVLFPLVF